MDHSKRYRFIPASTPPAADQIDLIGLNSESGLCITDYQQGNFYPRVTHYLIEDTAPFEQYAQAACDETINDLEKQLEQFQNQTIQLRDLFAIAALMAEFTCNRGSAIEPAVNFAYTIADKMLMAREADDRKPTTADRKATERVANKIINQMKGFDNGF
ncbi:hypothetical protein [Endozoicomonas acroporae]|uniref:hypothetical protein n=1 Tax=Endozoicomonas acroporae TaxID=1701104 RepID=UPI0013D089D2|nr:hypothetical protein [Endozoicomonas acroporae]